MTSWCFCLALAGCAAIAPEPAPEPVAQADADGWWHGFGSPELAPLVAQAQAQSQNTAAAVARVRQAQASSRIAGATLWPQVNGNLSASRATGNPDADGSLLGVGLSASYEIDFWGRNQAGQDAARASVRASQFDRDTVRLTLTARVASTWLQVLGLREQQTLADQQLATAQRLLQLVEARARAGAASLLDLAQQRGLVAAQRRSVAALAQQQADSLATLAVLLGQAQMPTITGVWADVRVPSVVAGLPSELLARRPDIARAEAQLTAADAQVAVARAAMLPSVVLAADIASSGPRLHSLFDNPLYTLAAGLAGPVFDADRRAAGYALAQAQRDELLAHYRAAILAAWSDARVALNALAGLDAQRAAQAEALAQARRALQLAESRHRAGADTLLALLEVQRTLAQAQDGAVQLKLAHLQAAVAVYRAFGGSWAEIASSV
ncbi:efflux transporter outer membrane subunit [Rhodoferax sp.]|uniref:efflux transporter outer membrane subunit n=1 Tax=Rhodoferax sp. TaxID=50421 RepID=UPI0025E74DF0|nr:efflux transporter outer membrane subunit [Rhodoferax sp.]